MAKLLLGKEVTAAMNEKLQARVAALKEKGVTPKLAIVRCGENPSDLSYERVQPREPSSSASRCRSSSCPKT